MLKKTVRASLEFDQRVWLLLLAMLAFRFGQGLYYPFSTIHFHNVVGIPLSLVGASLGALAAANVGWALGPMVAGLVAASVGSAGIYRTLFLGTSALTALVVLVLALAAEESLPATTKAPMPTARAARLRTALMDGPFLALLAAGVLLYYVFTQDWQALPIYAKNFVGVPDGRIGIFLGANGLMVILLQLPISYAIDRTSKIGGLLLGAALFASSSATLLLTESFLGILLAFAGFFTLAEMILEVAGAALAAELAPVRLRGTYLALFGACFGAAYGVSPIVGGTLLQAEMPDVIWKIQLGAAALAAVGLVVLGVISHQLSAKKPKAES